VKIWFTSGDPYESRNRDYTAAEAAAIARDFPWAAVDADGSVIVGGYAPAPCCQL